MTRPISRAQAATLAELLRLDIVALLGRARLNGLSDQRITDAVDAAMDEHLKRRSA